MPRLPTVVELAPHHAGKRVEKVLVAAIPGLREGLALHLVHRGKVLLDGRPLARGERLPGTGRLEVRAPDPRAQTSGPVADARVPLVLRHEDADVLVLEKPSGVAMQPGPGHGSGTLQNALVARFPELLALGPARSYGLVSRLDLEVSGLLVVARSVRAHEALVAAFAGREVEKRYRALVLGAPVGGEGAIESPVEGLEARTEWRLLERADAGNATVCLLALHPLTGRKHQLRIHLASVGLPILGDREHGVSARPIARRLGLRRIALHAERLAFRHPVSRQPLAFESAWPEDVERSWQAARIEAAGGPRARAPGRRRKKRSKRPKAT